MERKVKTLSSPKGKQVPITPSDDDDLPDGVAHALVCEAGGLVSFIDEDGIQRTGFPLQTGYNPIRIRRLLDTSMGATNVWALYDTEREIE